MVYANRTVSFLLEMGELAFYNDWDALKVSKALNSDGRVLKEAVVYCNWMREKIKALYDMKHPKDGNRERNYREVLDDKSHVSDLGKGQYITIEVDKSIPVGKEHRMMERRKKLGLPEINTNNNTNTDELKNRKDKPNVKI